MTTHSVLHKCLTLPKPLPKLAHFPARGAIAQLGERLHGMQEVAGSIPAGSTNKIAGKPLLSPSSRGLGHYPFTVATGVRIPVGTPNKKPSTQVGGFLLRALLS